MTANEWLLNEVRAIVDAISLNTVLLLDPMYLHSFSHLEIGKYIELETHAAMTGRPCERRVVGVAQRMFFCPSE